MAGTVTISVQFGLDYQLITIRESNRSTHIVCDVLGIEKDQNGAPMKIYLRSKIHSEKSEDVAYKEWEPSGAISTILTRVP